MSGDLSSLPAPPASPAPAASAAARVSLAAAAASIAGALFVGLTIEALAAGTIWSLGMLARLPWPVILTGEGLALAVSVLLTTLLARHAIRLEAMRAAGLPV